jgi:hypothetical protein
MGLDYTLDKIDGYRDVCWITGDDGERRMNPVTESLISMCASCGVSQITAQNARECNQRFRMYQMIYGPAIVYADGKTHTTTLDDVTAHVGLATNATAMTAAQFNNRFIEAARTETDSALFNERHGGR